MVNSVFWTTVAGSWGGSVSVGVLEATGSVKAGARQMTDLAVPKTDAWSAFVRTLTENEMPVWLSLSLAILAAIGTYFLAPRITRRLEIGKARSAHVISAITAINVVVIDLNKKIRSFLHAFRLTPDKVDFYRADILDLVTELQWRIIDLKVILKKKNDGPMLDGLGDKVEDLRKSIVKLEAQGDQESVLTQVANVSEDLKNILDRLYTEADLK